LSIIVFDGYLFKLVISGAFYILYTAPDESAPFNLSNELFADIASSVCLLLLLTSWILSYPQRSKNETAHSPSCL